MLNNLITLAEEIEDQIVQDMIDNVNLKYNQHPCWTVYFRICKKIEEVTSL